ncbi:MAG: hypothetical protein ACRDLF_04800 [Solirubrobacteraceae bacterium]
MAVVTTKERLHRLVDELSEDEAERTLGLMESKLDDPVLKAFNDAPEDDEPLTPEEEAALERSRQEYRRGEGVPLDSIRHEFC